MAATLLRMYDLIILGGGPGGYVAAERAAHAGLSTLLLESDLVGGTCLNRGCIPTKSLLAGAKVYRHALEGEKFGIRAKIEGASLDGLIGFDFAKAMAWKDDVVGKIRSGVEFSVKKAGAEIRKARGVLASPTSIRLDDGSLVEGRSIIVATGSSPARPPIPGLAGNPLAITSDEILALPAAPKRLVIIGGGVIGIEFASFFSAIGVEVSVIEMLPEILPFMDKELVSIYRRSLRAVKIETGAKVEAIEGASVRYTKGDETKVAEGDLVLVATGRRPKVAGIGLEELGIAHSPKGIVVDDSLRTNVPGIYAIGDVTGRSLLAHSASAMGEIAVETIRGKPRAMAWKAVPWVVYGDPECAGVGMTEEEAKAEGIDYAKAVIPARVSGRFLAENGQGAHGAVKLLAAKADGRILGATLVASYAGESIWGLQGMVERGATVTELEQRIFPHPTVSELFHEAAMALA
ncbi:MAG TPA: dihydrolipoyl dehydrogenase [Rectinemataceae bacterium]|nr:dihydrolipoyl dehydrogenase [Rectinemataceae bacterium]